MTRAKVLRFIANILIVAFALVAVAAGFATHYGHFRAEPVLSGSMRPVAQPGDLVFVKPAPTASLRVGEVVAFYPPGITGGAPYMHRIVTLSRVGTATTITTKGDANNIADPWGKVTLKSTTTDRLVYVVPKMGFVSVWMHNITHNTRSLVFVLAGCIVLLFGVPLLFGHAVMSRKGRHVRDDHVQREEVLL